MKVDRDANLVLLQAEVAGIDGMRLTTYHRADGSRYHHIFGGRKAEDILFDHSTVPARLSQLFG